jgi:hypothetical protein
VGKGQNPMKGKTQTQDTKAPKTVSRSTLVQAIVITFLATIIAGTIAGYFSAIAIHGQARQSVHSDIQLVSKDQ